MVTTLQTCSRHSHRVSTLTLLASSLPGTSARRRDGVRSMPCIVGSLVAVAPSLLLLVSWQKQQKEEYGVIPPNPALQQNQPSGCGRDALPRFSLVRLWFRSLCPNRSGNRSSSRLV